MNTVESTDIAELLELDKQIDFCEGEGIRQRWLFGRELLTRRAGKLLPRGLLEELVKQTGKSRSELQFRALFATKYPDEDQLLNAVKQFKSWHDIVNEGLSSNRRNSSPSPELPTEQAQLVLADPPWRYDFAETESRQIENQYPTLDVADICKLKPSTDNDCILLLWATAPKLQEALQVITAWGFEYKTNAVWDKGKIGMGYWFRGQHELLLVATKGKPSLPAESTRVSSVFREDRTDHSTKPECVYEWIDSAFPVITKLEMYSRCKRPGWLSWGNEQDS